ncbi:hypothetical protein [Halobellus sp. GM3]|uniref:hypothetical protein n=1 Tax=Halobellus sp. GM3 TaxID=3458410 RepID=UPI00403D8744
MTRRLNRRAFVALTATITAGCSGSGGPSDGGGGGSDPDFDSETESPAPAGTVSVQQQSGQGNVILIESAQANVDYRLVIEYGSTTVRSDVLSAGETFSGEVPLETPIREGTSVEVRVVSPGDRILDSMNVPYQIRAPGPELTADEAERVADSSFGLGDKAPTNRPWSFFDSWRGFPLAQAHNGWVVDVNWNSEHPNYKSDQLTWAEEAEQVQSVFAAHLYRGFYTSDYQVSRVNVNAFLNSGYDTGGNPQWKQSQHIAMDREAAKRIDWSNFVDLYREDVFDNETGDMSRLLDLASGYSFTYYADPDEDR